MGRMSSVRMVRIVRIMVQFVKNGAGMYWAGTRVTGNYGIVLVSDYWAQRNK